MTLNILDALYLSQRIVHNWLCSITLGVYTSFFASWK
jgi:hypothetical protein